LIAPGATLIRFLRALSAAVGDKSQDGEKQSGSNDAYDNL
jgi:hypothetical protein